MVYECDTTTGTWALTQEIFGPDSNAWRFGERMCLNQQASTIVAADNNGNLIMYNRTGNSWANGYDTVDLSTLLLTHDAVTGQTVNRVSMNAAGDLAISYSYYAAPSIPSDVYKLSVWEDVVNNGLAAPLINDLQNDYAPFANLTHCDAATSDYVSDHGFMATTSVNDTSTGVWISSSGVNPGTYAWPFSVTTPENLVTFPVSNDIRSTNAYSTSSAIVPVYLSPTEVKLMVGTKSNTVVYEGLNA